MKASELRIGNWFNNGDSNYVVDSSWFCDYLGSLGEHFTVNPIPLTEEWLLKFGFEKKINDDDFDYWLKGEFDDTFLCEHADGFCYNFGFGHELKHVHQLQNLYFALTGEELTTK